MLQLDLLFLMCCRASALICARRTYHLRGAAPRGLRSTQHKCAPVVAPRPSRHAPGPLPASAHTRQAWEPHVSLTSAHSAARCSTHQAPSMRMQKCDVHYNRILQPLHGWAHYRVHAVAIVHVCAVNRGRESSWALHVSCAIRDCGQSGCACGHYSNSIHSAQ
jgi:hypothetical protein